MNTSNLENPILLESFDSELIQIFQWGSWKSPILLGLLAVTQIFSLGGKTMIINYIARYAPRERPINTVMMIDQIVPLMSTALLGSMVGLSLVQGDTLQSMISPAGCHFFWLTITVTNGVLANGGLTMALLRIIVIKWEIMGAESQKVMWKLLAVELMLVLEVVVGIGYGNYYSGTGLAYTFCRGTSTEMNKIIAEYRGSSKEDIDFGVKVSSTVTGGCYLNVIIEFLIYWYLHRFQFEHNTQLAAQKVLPQDVIVARHKKNIITMRGQALTFSIECCALVLNLIMLNLKIEGFEAASYPLILYLYEAMITVSHVWSSPELRSFYWNHL